MSLAMIMTAALMLPAAPPSPLHVRASPSAQTPGRSTAIVLSDAPIFIKPNATTPLRVAAPQTTLNVLSEQGDWVEVEFQDPQWGRRVGWVERRLIRVQTPDLKPMDLSVTNPRSDVERRRDNPSQQTSANAEQEPPPRDVVGHPQTRSGFWFSAGLGFGSLGCQDCVGRINGLSGGLSLGGTVNRRLLIGMGTSGWARTEDGTTLTVGTLDFRVRVYPAVKSGFFLTGGIGLGTVSLQDETEYGAGVVLGAGWDIRVGRNVSLTPFWNGFAMSNSTIDANVGQLGLAVTIH